MADTAKDIYKNSITEMSTLARLLLAREKADAERRKRWDSQVSVSGKNHRVYSHQQSYQELEDVATRLKTVSELIDTVITAATPQLQNEMTAVVSLSHSQESPLIIRYPDLRCF
jgi:pantothenate kinase